MLTVPLLWIGKELSKELTDLLLRSERLTDPLLWNDNVSRDLEHVPGQLVPMSCHSRDTLSI